MVTRIGTVQLASRKFGVATVIMKPWEREDVERWIDHSIQIANMKRSLAKMRE